MAIATIRSVLLGIFTLSLCPAMDLSLCAGRVVIPKYPELAKRAKVEASVSTYLKVGASGALEIARSVPTKDEASAMTKLFEAQILASLKGTTISRKCAAKEFKIRYEFRIVGLEAVRGEADGDSFVDLKQGVIRILVEPAPIWAD